MVACILMNMTGKAQTKTTLIILGLIFASVFSLVGCTVKASDKELVYLDDGQLLAAVQRHEGNMLLIDTRNEEEYARGTIPGAVNVQLRDIQPAEARSRFGKYKRIIVFADNPGSPRAAAVSKRLIAAGLSGVETYLPGYEGWLNLQKSAGQDQGKKTDGE